jgi:hypothetical protein
MAKHDPAEDKKNRPARKKPKKKKPEKVGFFEGIRRSMRDKNKPNRIDEAVDAMETGIKDAEPRKKK